MFDLERMFIGDLIRMPRLFEITEGLVILFFKFSDLVFDIFEFEPEQIARGELERDIRARFACYAG